jgi:PncC family amidohydrolase
MTSKIHNWFLNSDRKLAIAESCTGGLLSSLITKNSGSSKYFLGSIVSYDASVKISQLKVRPSSISCFGEVSIPVAREMARGVKNALKSDYAVSITGIAGPTGGTPDKPVGTVCFAVVGAGIDEFVTRHFDGTREQIQLSSAQFALEFLWDSTQK